MHIHKLALIFSFPETGQTFPSLYQSRPDGFKRQPRRFPSPRFSQKRLLFLLNWKEGEKWC
jgi:hypothetical protein